MDFLVNDLSLHGQFPDIPSFKASLDHIMEIRQIIKRSGREIYCNKGMVSSNVTPSMNMPQVVNHLAHNEKRVLIQWLTNQGPFWEDARKHDPDEYLESNGIVVTDSAVAEAAWCIVHDIERYLVSFAPSEWQSSPIVVDWTDTDDQKKHINVKNFWEPGIIDSLLQNTPVPIKTWKKLESLSKTKCTNISFSNDAFKPLEGLPFSHPAALRIAALLEILNRFKRCFDHEGKRTPEGHEIYKDFFTGKKGDGGRGPLFSDSSDTEKRNFRTELTFNHPGKKNNTLFCPWHGKVQTPQLRIHFSWPIRSSEPIYVVYVGEKITRK